jgi:protein-S-isoprenylcysteine O-methyltransferase Ste14
MRAGDIEGKRMKFLELKVPPPLVMLLFGAAMWFVARVTTHSIIPHDARLVVAVVLVVCAAVVALSGIVAFRRARTTVNPLHPDASTSIVTTGIFRFTRNPMYLGLFLVLLAWSVLLSNVIAAFIPVLFVIYMNVFQIGPEERALATKFGAVYADYLRVVRRWI